MLSSELILIHTYLPNAPVNWTLSQNLCEIHLRGFLLHLTAFFSCSQNLYGNLFCRTAGLGSCAFLMFFFRLKTVVFVLDTRWYPFPLVTRWYSFLDHFSVVFVLDAIPSTFGYSAVSLPGSFIIM